MYTCTLMYAMNWSIDTIKQLSYLYQSVRMSTPRLPHLLLLLEGLHEFIPGLIHAFKEDGGAKSIAGFTNYEKAKPEILWAFRIIGRQSNQ